MSMSVQEIMTRKPMALSASDKAIEAARLMREVGIGNVLVVEEDGSLCGVVTDRDLVVRLMAHDRDPKEVDLGSMCSRELVTLDVSSTVEEAEDLMKKRAVRRIPVLDRGKPVGIIALGDLAAARERHSTLGAISAAPPNN